MTVIAAVVHEGRVVMGGDSAGCSQWDLTVRADPKVFRTGEFLFGFTESFRMGQILRYVFEPPECRGDTYRYMVTDFVDTVRACLKGRGWAKKEAEREAGGQFLVGFRGRIFEVDGEYQVAENADKYAAVGCGHGYAKGALYATRGYPPRERIVLALEAAERWSNGVRGPFLILGAGD